MRIVEDACGTFVAMEDEENKYVRMSSSDIKKCAQVYGDDPKRDYLWYKMAPHSWDVIDPKVPEAMYQELLKARMQ